MSCLTELATAAALHSSWRTHLVQVVEIEMPGHGSFSAGMPQLSLSSCADVRWPLCHLVESPD
eukprot:SAG31_NODE_24552_length_479_cov_0.673684_1_plen_62_part_10